MAGVVKKKAKLKKKHKPLPNGQSDRDSKGQFVRGNKASKGIVKKSDKKSRTLKNALIEAVTEKDIKAIAKKLISKAKKGEVIAIRELFDRLWGRAKQEVEIGDKTFDSLVDIAARMAGAN